MSYNPFLVYCRELAPGTVSLTGDWAQGDDSKHDSHYICLVKIITIFPHDPFYEGIFSHVRVSVHCIFPQNDFV